MASVLAPLFTGKTWQSIGQETLLQGKHGVFAVQEALNTAIHLALSNLNGSMHLLSTLTTGGTQSLRSASIQLDAGLGKSIGKTYMNLLKMVNPNARRLKKTDMEDRREFASSDESLPVKQMPLFLFSFSKFQQKVINSLNSSSWWINRQITVRVVAPLSSAIGALTGAGMFAIGAASAALSILTLGRKPILNTLAYQSLKAPGWMQNQLRQITLSLFRPALLSSKKETAETKTPLLKKTSKQ